MKMQPSLTVVLSLFVVSVLGVYCTSENIGTQKTLDAVSGNYIGSNDNGGVVTFTLEPRNAGPNAFSVNDFRGVAYPFVDLDGTLDGDILYFDDYHCTNCEFLPSPGGNPRFYTASLTASGKCIIANDSINMYIDYVHSGTGALEYHGWVRMAKEQ